MPGGSRTQTGLSRDRIVDVAIDLAEREGLAVLSMRRLAAELGAGTMSIYNHVADKDDLLDAIAARVAGEVHLATSTDWRDVVTSWATESRRVLLEHRALIPVVIAPKRFSHIGGVGLAVVETLRTLGLSDDDAVLVVRIVARYFSGSVLFDAPWGGEARAPRRELDATFTSGLTALLDGLEQQVGRG